MLIKRFEDIDVWKESKKLVNRKNRLTGLPAYRLTSLTAQSIIEYVLLFMIVVAAMALTNRYVYRSMNARLKQVQEELSYKK